MWKHWSWSLSETIQWTYSTWNVNIRLRFTQKETRIITVVWGLLACWIWQKTKLSPYLQCINMPIIILAYSHHNRTHLSISTHLCWDNCNLTTIWIYIGNRDMQLFYFPKMEPTSFFKQTNKIFHSTCTTTNLTREAVNLRCINSQFLSSLRLYDLYVLSLPFLIWAWLNTHPNL